MNQKLLSDNSGVSPVIGVILMVAITVILAAVIGTFVMDLGQNAASQQASAGVDVAGNTATLTSLGSNTDGIKCANDEDEKTENIGGQITCSDAIVAYSNDGSVQEAAVHTFD